MTIPEDGAQGRKIGQQMSDFVLDLPQTSRRLDREAIDLYAQGVKLSFIAASKGHLNVSGSPSAVLQSQLFRSPFGPSSSEGTITRPRAPNSRARAILLAIASRSRVR